MINKLIKFCYSIIVLLGIGLVYGWSVFVAPLEAEFGWNRADTALTFTISMSALCIGLLIGGYINRTSDKPILTLTIAGVLIFSGLFLTSSAIEIWQFYVFYGMFSGLGTGLAYVEIIAVGGMMFPNKKGLISGILFMAFGLGALILGTVCSTLMGVIGWRTIFKAIGILFGISIFVEGFVLKSECEKRNEYNLEVKNTDKSNKYVSTFEMIKRKEFILFYIWLIFITSSGLAMMAHIAPYIIEIGFSSRFAAIVSGVVSMCNGLGRVIYGIAYDKFKVKCTMAIISVVFIAAAIAMVLSSVSGNLILLIIGCILIGISFGGAPISSSIVVNSLYGDKFYSSNFGVVSTQIMISAVIGPYISSKLYMMSGEYNTTFYAIFAFSIISLLTMRMFFRVAEKMFAIE